MTALQEVEASTVKQWLDHDEAVLIDVREADEYAREHILGSRLVPLSGFDRADFPAVPGKKAVFHCASGNRTALNAQRILATGFPELYHLKGGLAGWKSAGYPLHVDKSAPISVMRQVQLTAGSLVVIGVLLAFLVSPWFMGLSAFVGAGLMFAGGTGTCAMANLLGLMPWNRPMRGLAETQA